ncbi:surface glycoprotein [Halorussus marinus]|uniref:surface glycoprotein n=1 Tax=Halorussus marinus TaxID=2505976 RepID=UPI001091B9DB|nr:surface glycoprotein [Halorussus marinus]
MTREQTRDKLRAVFLSALMVVSVFGGTVAFAGTAAANASNFNVQTEEPVKPGEPVTIQSEATANTDVTFAIDSAGNTENLNEIGTSNAGNDGVASITFTPTDESVPSDADKKYDLYAAEGSTLGSASDSDTQTTLTVDGVAPTIENFQITNEDPTDTQSVEVSFTSDERLETIDATVKVDGQQDGTLSSVDFSKNGDTYTATYDGSSDGDYTIILNTAADKAGNDGADGESDSVTVDTQQPSISKVTTNFVENSNVLEVTAVANNEALDSSSISADVTAGNNDITTLSNDDWSSVGDTQYGYQATYNVPTKTEAKWTVDVTSAADLAGNEIDNPDAGVSQDSLDVDTSAFALSIDQPKENVDVQSGDVVDVKYSYKDTNPESVVVTLTDQQDDDTYTYNIDDSQYANDNAQKSLTIDLSEHGEAGDTLADGVYDVTVMAEDPSSGTSSATQAKVVTVDDTPPVFKKNADDTVVTDFTQSKTTTGFKIDLSDDTSGVDASTIEVDVTQNGDTTTWTEGDEGVSYDSESNEIVVAKGTLSLSEGYVTIQASADDNSGNSKTSEKETYTINTEAPAITGVEAEAGDDTVTVKFSEAVTAADGDFSKDDFAYTDVSGDGASEITGVEAKELDNGFTDEVELTLDTAVAASDLEADEVNARKSALEDRKQDNVKATDAATVVLKDTTSPSEDGWFDKVDAPTINEDNNGDSYTVTVTVSEPASIDSVGLTLDDGEGNSVSTDSPVSVSADGTAEITLTTTSLTEGDIEVRADAYDVGGQESLDQIIKTDLTKDTEAPKLASVKTDVGTQELYLKFDEYVNPGQAVKLGNYQTPDGIDINTLVHDGGDTYTAKLDSPVTADVAGNNEKTIVPTSDIEDSYGNDAAGDGASLEDRSAPMFAESAALTSDGSTEVTVSFTEKLFDADGNAVSAEDFTYVNNGDDDGNKVTDASYGDGPTEVVLTLDSKVTADDLNTDAITTSAVDSVGNALPDGASATLTVDIGLEEPELTSEDGKTVKMSFTTDEELDSFDASLYATENTVDNDNDGVEDLSRDLDESDFEETENDDGTFTYVNTVDVPRDGGYKFSISSTTAVGGMTVNYNDEKHVDSVDVDTEAPSPVDAEIVSYNGVETEIAVQFSEPVALTGPTAISLDGSGFGEVDSEREESNQITVTIHGAVQTGDEPKIVFASDSYAETTSDSSQGTQDGVVVNTLESQLSAGANFVSVPAASGELSVSEVVTQLGGEENVDSIMTYDGGEWQTYNPTKPSDKQDFDAMQGGQGYIVTLSESAEFEVNVNNVVGGSDYDDGGTPQATQLEEGWNLVGQWQEGWQNADTSEALASVSDGVSDSTAVYGQVGNGYQYTTVSNFNPGEAYWVFATEDTWYTESQTFDRLRLAN